MTILSQALQFIKWFLVFGIFYVKEVLLSNWRVAKLVLHPRPKFHDKVATFKTPVENSVQLVFLMNLITMTPGTISLNFDPDQSTLEVHFLFDDEIAEFQKKLDDYYLPFLRAVVPWSK